MRNVGEFLLLKKPSDMSGMLRMTGTTGGSLADCASVATALCTALRDAGRNGILLSILDIDSW